MGQDAGPLNLAAGERKGRHLRPQIQACSTTKLTLSLDEEPAARESHAAPLVVYVGPAE